MEARYSGAWSELNARLMSRQKVSISYANVSIAIFAISLAYRNADAATPLSALTDWLVLLLPMLSLAHVCWICHNDITIGLLSKFCEECEKWQDKDVEKNVPSWHSAEQGMMQLALKYRKFSDAGFIVILLTTFSVALVKLIKSAPNSATVGAVGTVSLFAGLAALILIITNGSRRAKLLSKSGYVPAGEDQRIVFASDSTNLG